MLPAHVMTLVHRPGPLGFQMPASDKMQSWSPLLYGQKGCPDLKQ